MYYVHSTPNIFNDMSEVKNCLFQYATSNTVIEDTCLITESEAEEMWGKYLEDIKTKWDAHNAPQMCIWIDCRTNSDYHTVGKEIDYQDCELIDGAFYRVRKELIS